MRDSLSPLIYPPTYSGQKFPQRTYKWQFYPWGDTLLLCKMSVYIQTHKIFPIQKICKSVTKKIFVKNSKSPGHQLATPPCVPPRVRLLSRPPTGSVGAPTGSVGAPTGNVGAPTGNVGAPTGSVGAPTGPVDDPNRDPHWSVKDTRWDRHQPALCSPHGQVPRPPTGKSRPPTGNSSESYIQAGSEVHPVGGRWEEVSTLRYSLINSSLTADATVDIVPMQEEQIYISIGETYPP